jgi:hypothetical protein
MMGFRAPPMLRASIVKWAENQSDKPRLSEAVRRLVEIGLSSPAPRPTARNPGRAARAAELAAKVIDKQLDPDVPAERREARRRELLHGPSGFRNVRKDHAG